jgi:hypothetical protein
MRPLLLRRGVCGVWSVQSGLGSTVYYPTRYTVLAYVRDGLCRLGHLYSADGASGRDFL